MARSNKDRIYASKQDKVDKFVFDQNVAGVFQDMIERSVPGYNALNQLLPIVANQFIQENSNVYDLGCSLGEATISIANAANGKNIVIHAVDNSSAMISQLESRLKSLKLNARIELLNSDVNDVDMMDGSFVILNYTLQFIDRSKRDALISNVCSSLMNKGALLISEKIRYDDKEEDLIMQQLHENYKRQNDYSDMEISQKREALEDVLVRDTHEQHIERLKNAGFSKVSILTKYLNFVSYLAIK
ncbi:MAG: carboxy-S-adenosyl-L-methionine synthase CmoA [Gammaproteobacteria bacterium]